jgi:hypothetical protein
MQVERVLRCTDFGKIDLIILYIERYFTRTVFLQVKTTIPEFNLLKNSNLILYKIIHDLIGHSYRIAAFFGWPIIGNFPAFFAGNFVVVIAPLENMIGNRTRGAISRRTGAIRAVQPRNPAVSS